MTVVELIDGKSLLGRVEERTDQSLKLISPQGEPLEIALDTIKKMTESNTSVMPPMGAILTKREIRDIIEYLSTLKSKK